MNKIETSNKTKTASVNREPETVTEIQVHVQKTLALLLGQQNITEAELSRQTGITASTINRLLLGTTPDMRVGTLRPIANFFNVTVSQLIGDEPISILDNNKYTAKKVIQVPLIPWDKSAEWKSLANKYTHSNWVYWTTVPAEAGPSCYALEMGDGHSFPFLSQSILVVDPLLVAKNTKYIIAQHQDGFAMIKKMIFEGNKKWLISLSPTIPAVFFDDSWIINGVVVQIITAL